MKYKIIMTCMQHVSTSIIVEADNYDEACDIAKDSIHDCVWSGMDLEEDFLRIESWDRLEKNS